MTLNCKQSIGGRGDTSSNGEMFPMLVVDWQASVVRGKEAGHFCKVAGVSITAGSPPVDTF